LAQKYTAPYVHNMKYRFLSPKINQNLRRNTPLKRQRYISETIPKIERCMQTVHFMLKSDKRQLIKFKMYKYNIWCYVLYAKVQNNG